jgi:serine/threonine protein kinase
MAPEVRAQIKRLCGRRSDMWSYGVVVLQMLLGRVPDVFITWVVREGANEDTVTRAVQVRMWLELVRGGGVSVP